MPRGPEEIEETVLYPDESETGTEYLEVHVYGPISIRSVGHVAMGIPHRNERAIREDIKDVLPSYGIGVDLS